VIFGGSFGYMDSMEMVAADFPGQYFIHISGFKANEENFGNLMGAMENMKYMAGMISGARAKLDGATKTGYIATFPIPEETRLGNAYALGLQKTCPECTMDVRWIYTWHDPILEREAADSLFDAGSHVVYTGADTPATALAAEARGDVWGITYDWDGSCTSDRCLTAPYWNWGPEFLRIVDGIRDGSYTPGWDYFDSNEGGVGIYGLMEGQELTPGMAELKEKMPEEWAMIEAELAALTSGEKDRFDVFAGPIIDNQGNVVLAEGEKMDHADIDCFAVWGTCEVGMYWWNENVTAELPEID
jgi:basic membrane protein A and related proteins